jgi:hippurate hydrolase
MPTTTDTATLRADAEALLPSIVEVRRRLHRIPEIGLALPKTQAVVADEVRALGLEPVLGRSTSAVTAVIQGTGVGPGADRTIVLRGDMDGLPLTEDTGLEFASEHPGAMHACGHDTHVAMLLGGARLLVARRDEFAGRAVLMFQPGEEGYHGARFMLDDGLLDGIEGTPGAAAFAIHISTRYRTGRLRLRSGPLLAAADRLVITVRGRGGHASAPFLAVDPIAIAAELVIALQLMVTRTVDALDPAVITIARITAGTTNNIIPPSAELEGTMRTLSETVRAEVKDRIRQVAAGIGAAHGAAVDVLIDPGYPVTFNDPGLADLVRSVGTELVGREAVEDLEAPIMGAEDFSYVLQRLPGAMVFLGARPFDAPLDTTPQNHSNLVVFDEAPMALGAATYAAVALRHLAAR